MFKQFQIQNINEYQKAYEKSINKPEEFWAEIAENFLWKKKWDKVLNWNFEDPKVEWFKNGKLNITENCLDRFLEIQPEKNAIIWEPNNPNEKEKKITYRELHSEVCKFANVLKKYNVQKGDRVCIYLPMIPELTISILACARIGAIHSVVFAGFSSVSISDRINDSQCKLMITADASYRGDKTIPLKEIADNAIKNCPSIQKLILVERTNQKINFNSEMDVLWKNEMEVASSICEPAVMDSEDALFILYTSGSTGKPKGVVHTIAGYMVYTFYTFLNVFQYKFNDIYFCTADVGWITGHSYLVYGPLLNGATSVMFEGIPSYPDCGRFWEIIEKYNVNIFYTAPTAIRSLMLADVQLVENKKMESLRVLGTVGEPINEEAYNWYFNKVGKNNCPIVDTWWQTETGGILISSLAGVTTSKPTFAGLPLPGIHPILLDEKGNEILEENVQGNLCFKFPWPSIMRTTYGDHERCKLNYFSTYNNYYFTGDGAFKDENGLYRIVGRVDDVINVSGHRIGTAEVENAINLNSDVIESAVVGYPHDLKGQGIFAFVILKPFKDKSLDFHTLIKDNVAKEIGHFAKPDKILFVDGLPKTRSGKIMRRILRKIAENDISNIGDTSTLIDPTILDQIIANINKNKF